MTLYLSIVMSGMLTSKSGPPSDLEPLGILVCISSVLFDTTSCGTDVDSSGLLGCARFGVVKARWIDIFGR